MPLQRAFTRFSTFPAREVFSQLHAFVQQEPITCRTDCRGCTGSLTDVALCVMPGKKRPSLTGTFEVISLNGTQIDRRASASRGIGSLRGHARRPYAMPGVATVRTTLELVIGELPALTFSRQRLTISGWANCIFLPLIDDSLRGTLWRVARFPASLWCFDCHRYCHQYDWRTLLAC